ncbi:MAG: glycine cleavage system protein GcvH [Marmoricola sp.]
MHVPSNLSYTAEHEWLDLKAGTATVGVTAFATAALGDVVFVELPDVGAKVTSGESCGEIESTKSVSDLYAPADGEVIAVNQAVIDDPALLNTDPFGEGWLFRLAITGSPELLQATAYQALIGGE